jgi:hypothetical protein
MDPPALLLFAADAATCTAAAFNVASLLSRRSAQPSAGRRNAISVLAALNAGIVIRAALGQALCMAGRCDWPAAAHARADVALAARLPLLAGTVMLSLLIVRRRSAR